MVFLPHFMGLFLLLTGSARCIKICLGNSELSPETLEYITSGSLLDRDTNLISLLRAMRNGGVVGLIQHYTDNCSSWSYETFSRVRSFVLAFPRVAQLLMSAECYINLSNSVREEYSLDNPNVVKDFNEGLLGVYPNPVLSGQLIVQLKFASFLEEFDPEGYLSVRRFGSPGESGKAKSSGSPENVVDDVLFAYIYRAVEMIPDLMQSLKIRDTAQIVSFMGDYAVKIHKDNVFAFVIIYVAYGILNKIRPGEESFAKARDSMLPLIQQGYLEQTSLVYSLEKSILLADQYPYGEEHFKVRRFISDLELDNRSLVRYATLLTISTRTPFESCRFFLGTENMKKLQSSPLLLSYPEIDVCWTNEELLLYKRKWASKPVSGNFIFELEGDEGHALEIGECFIELLPLRADTIELKPGNFRIERSIRFLIGSINANGEVIKIRTVESSNDKKLSFPLSVFHDGTIGTRIKALIKLVISLNFHYGTSWSLETETLDKVFDILHDNCSASEADEELIDLLNKLAWIFNRTPKYSDELAEYARQIDWNSII